VAARKKAVTLKGVYGKPLAKQVGSSIPLTEAQLQRMGKIILKAIRREILRDMALVAGIRAPGAPVPLPMTNRFPDSFKVKVQGSVIQITSNWPTARAHTTDAVKMDPDAGIPAEPSAPIPMIWLTRPSVPYAQIVQKDGEVVVRTTPDPSKGDKPWIHPGFKKYTFLDRGIRKGRKEAIEMILQESLADLLSKTDLF